MLKAGDHVFIDGTHDEGVVKDVHAHESLRLDPTLDEASRFVDH